MGVRGEVSLLGRHAVYICACACVSVAVRLHCLPAKWHLLFCLPPFCFSSFICLFISRQNRNYHMKGKYMRAIGCCGACSPSPIFFFFVCVYVTSDLGVEGGVVALDPAKKKKKKETPTTTRKMATFQLCGVINRVIIIIIIICSCCFVSPLFFFLLPFEVEDR
ncbi:hypothetical protein NQL31_006544 [Lotmaria passim]